MRIFREKQRETVPEQPVQIENDFDVFHPVQHFVELLDLVGRINDYDEILGVISRKAMVIFPADYICLIMINPRTQHTLKTVIKSNMKSKSPITPLLQTNIIGWVSKKNSPLMSENISRDERFSSDIRQGSNNLSIMCIPIERHSCVVGYILFGRSDLSSIFQNIHLYWAQKFSLLIAPYLSDLKLIQKYFTPPLPQTFLVKKYEPYGLIGQSEKFIDMLKSVEAAARCDVRVLLEGESGTGKELVAHAIHHLSSRNNQPFVAIDCGAIPEHLIESELFGHIKGSFTGASTDRTGLFQEADHGTLFIDEISNLPLPMQVKLLRVMQEGEIRPLGSNKSRKIDVRIISASGPSLKELVNKKLFRPDLYFRLHVYPIVIPSLAERITDIPILANYFVCKFARKQDKNAQMLPPEFLKHLQQKSWPGNIRELENFIERLVTLTPPDMKIIDYGVFSEDIRNSLNIDQSDLSVDRAHPSLQDQINEYELQIIREMLDKTGWNQSEAARQLNISERTIRYKIKKLGLKRY